MDDCCDICGGTGFGELIFKCVKCKTNQEHNYCMQTPCKPTEDWVCEECTVRNVNQSPCANNRNLSEAAKSKISFKDQQEKSQSPYTRKLQRGIGSIDWEKKVSKGKTRYLPVEEALMLKTHNVETVTMNHRSNPLSPRKHISSPFPRTPVNKADHISKLKKPEKQPTSSGLRQQINQAARSRVQSPKVLKGSDKDKTVQTTAKRYIEKQLPPKASNPTVEAKQTQECVEKKRNDTSSPLQSPFSQNTKKSGGEGFAAMELETSKENRMTFSTNFKECLTDPVVHPSWKGSFNICDGLNFKGLQAHRPFRVHRKADEFSKLLPEVLDFKLVPRQNFWEKLFCDYCPTREDIGLYFFPSDRERSKEYTTLLELIRVQDVMMTMQMDGVEVLVLTSTVLHVDCQKVEGEYFLWGLFHRVGKTDKGEITEFVDKEIDITIAQIVSEVDFTSDKENEEVEMEIDMIGGKDVGKVDIVIPRMSSRNEFASSTPEAAAIVGRTVASGFQENVMPKYGGKNQYGDVPPGFKDNGMKKRGGNQPYGDVPPGFEPLWNNKKPKTV